MGRAGDRDGHLRPRARDGQGRPLLRAGGADGRAHGPRSLLHPGRQRLRGASGGARAGGVPAPQPGDGAAAVRRRGGRSGPVPQRDDLLQPRDHLRAHAPPARLPAGRRLPVPGALRDPLAGEPGLPPGGTRQRSRCGVRLPPARPAGRRARPSWGAARPTDPSQRPTGACPAAPGGGPSQRRRGADPRSAAGRTGAGAHGPARGSVRRRGALGRTAHRRSAAGRGGVLPARAGAHQRRSGRWRPRRPAQGGLPRSGGRTGPLPARWRPGPHRGRCGGLSGVRGCCGRPARVAAGCTRRRAGWS